MQPFPEFKQPTVLGLAECRLVIESYQRWMAGELQRRGIEIREFDEFNAAISGLRRLPYTTRWLTMIGPTSPLVNLASNTKSMGLRAPNFAPIKELEGDLAMLVAETAEPSIRTLKKSGGMHPHAGAAAMVFGPLANISTLEKVRELYAFASVIYAGCATAIFKMMESAAPTDPQRTQYLIVDQLLVKYLGAIGRTLLMDLDIWIEEHVSNVDISAASAGVILPIVARYPEARGAILRDEVLQFPFGVIAHGGGHEFNNEALAMGFFINTAIIAGIVGYFASARRACNIASAFAGDEPPPQLQEFRKLVETLDPQAKA